MIENADENYYGKNKDVNEDKILNEDKGAEITKEDKILTNENSGAEAITDSINKVFDGEKTVSEDTTENIDLKINDFFNKYPALVAKAETIKEYFKNNPELTDEKNALEIAALHILADEIKIKKEKSKYEEYIEKLENLHLPVTIGSGGGLTPNILDKPKTIEEANKIALSIFKSE